MHKEITMKLPAFTAELSLRESGQISTYRIEDEGRRENLVNRVIPASHKSYCNRMLRRCISGSNPRSSACDYWLFNCY
jgi:hypothetical protein